MNFRSIISTIVLILVSLGLLYLGYHYLSGGSADATPGLEAEGFATGEGATPADEFLQTLTGLQELNLRGEVFQNPVFRDLKDSTIVLPDLVPGRNNPFAPVNFATAKAVVATTTPRASTPVAPSVSSSGSSGSSGLENLRAR